MRRLRPQSLLLARSFPRLARRFPRLAKLLASLPTGGLPGANDEVPKLAYTTDPCRNSCGWKTNSTHNLHGFQLPSRAKQNKFEAPLVLCACWLGRPRLHTKRTQGTLWLIEAAGAEARRARASQEHLANERNPFISPFDPERSILQSSGYRPTGRITRGVLSSESRERAPRRKDAVSFPASLTAHFLMEACARHEAVAAVTGSGLVLAVLFV